MPQNKTNINLPGFVREIAFAPGAQLDPFGKPKFSQAIGLTENKQISSRLLLQWEERLWGAIINHGTVTGTGFVVGETIVEKTLADVVTGKEGVITAVATGQVTYNTKNNDFTDTYKIVGLTSGSSAIITNHNTGAHIEYSYNRASSFLKLGTLAGQRVVRQTVRYFPYIPKKGHVITHTGVWGAGKANCKQLFLYGDDLNAIGYCLNGTEVAIVVRTNTSGSPNTVFIPQSTWNVDKLNGLGPSRIALDPTKLQIQDSDFAWLAAGNGRYFFNINGRDILVHVDEHANKTDVAWLRTPSLPLRVEIINDGVTSSATQMEQICSAIESDGGYTLPGLEWSCPPIEEAVERAVLVGDGVVPCLIVRPKREFPPGKPNRKTMRYLDARWTSRTNEAWFEVLHVHGLSKINGNPVNNATWKSVDDDCAGEYLIEYSPGVPLTSFTATHTHAVQEDYAMVSVGGGGASSGNDSSFINNHSFASQNFEADGICEAFIIRTKARAATANIWSHLSWLDTE